MNVLIMIVSVLLIVIVLLQSGKAEGASQSLGGGSSDLFGTRKERGLELLISRITAVLGVVFFVLCILISL